WEGMKEITEATKSVLRQAGHGEALDELLGNPERQLLTAVRAVHASWNAESARRYREFKHLCDSWHTAVIVQEMALGNRKSEEIREGMDETRASLTGVVPRTVVRETGTRECTGDFKFAAAGDDLVGGLTQSISFRPIDELDAFAPMLNRRLRHTIAKLRRFMGADQEIEFTVENGVLSILQSRAAEVGVNRRLATFADPGPEAGHGVGVRGGGFRGLVAFDEQDLREAREQDLSRRDDVDGIIVVLENPSPEEIPLLLLADGLLAAKGGSTSHAAIAINSIEDRDYSAVLGVEGLRVHARRHEAEIVDAGGKALHTIRAGDIVSIHGTTGAVFVGTRALREH
ncbi:MAG: PEP-utilizing enzyme, partial [Candidatus Krumholzibacteria bacterium]|nr:PEP-utilizing enzyme [Candidatus Krumholzibacteria bacterium]